MRTPTRISAWAVTMLLALGTASNDAAVAVCLWGYGQCESASLIAGEYVQDGNSAMMLTITANRMTAKTGPVSFSIDYTVKSVDGKTVTIEMSEWLQSSEQLTRGADELGDNLDQPLEVRVLLPGLIRKCALLRSFRVFHQFPPSEPPASSPKRYIKC